MTDRQLPYIFWAAFIIFLLFVLSGCYSCNPKLPYANELDSRSMHTADLFPSELNIKF